MSENLRGFFNGLLIFFFGYNLITGIFFIKDGLRAREVSETYTIIESQFSIVGMGLLFIMAAAVGCMAYFRKDKTSPLLMTISSAMSFILMIYYGFTLLTVEPMTVIAYRYIYIAIVHFSMVVGGVLIWWREKKKDM